MADSSPLLPIRQPNPRTPTWEQDTIPCSPGALMRETQPTQILPITSSPSIIEVPASSPFQKPRFGSRLAPAGTVFRPPPVRPVSSPRQLEPVSISLLSDDDEDSLQLPRGDIRPTDFKSHVSAFAYKPRVDDEILRKRLRQVYDVFGDKFSPDTAREALWACDNDLEDAIQMLQEKGQKKKRRLAHGRRPSLERLTRDNDLDDAIQMLEEDGQKKKRRLVHGRRPSPERLARDNDLDDTIQMLEEEGRKRKRRLVHGRRPSLVSPKPASPPERSSPLKSQSPVRQEVILIEDDADDYEEEVSGPEENDRVLESINNSTLQELAAMTGLKENLLEPIIDHRPFADLCNARKLTVKKPGSRKGGNVSIGDTVVDAVQIFLEAVTAIDEVVATCEAKACTVKSVMDTWDLDCFGHSKSRDTPENGAPLTPNSVSSFVPPLVPQQPALMDGHCLMKPFQLFGLNWMTLLNNYDIGCILADEMGLGKTCQVISLICHLVESSNDGSRPWPNLIVVPPSTYKNWLGEFEKFAPGLSIIGYRGSQSERAEIAYQVEQDLDAYHVVLATYSQINSEADLEAMQSFRLNAAIFDEGHKMKNPETKIYRDLRRIPAAWKMLLTGTPVQNNLLEMTSLLNFINPQLFDGYMQHIQYIFSQKVTIRNVSNGAFLYSERVKRARTILEPFILQRRKDQVLSDLPRKICNVAQCAMTDDQALTYAEYEELFKTAPSQRKSSGRQNDQNNVWMQLRKATLHPLLFRRHFTDTVVTEMAKMLMERIPQCELHQPDMKHLVQELKNSSDFELHLWCRDYPFLKQFDIVPGSELNSGKVKKLLQLIQQYQANGDRVLVFSKFSRLIELLQEVLATQGIAHRVLVGNTNVSERQDLIDEFNSDPEIPVFLLTTGAGGTGINLTSANKIVIFDQSDNPQDDIQAENRAHRLGQTRDVEVIRLISTGTIEELIYKACQKKIELANKVTGVEGEDGDAGVNLETEVRRMMRE